ncbi:conjugal transfer protein [Mycolicibacterium fortuitum]|uniref:conjugal transfer protein n=1 Tax=Mycolicibacterium fortuitum TaxID=1766 RepID=UPI001CE11257|nr:conjugal transfer protein [Mycolicibacterium fortuitum]MCA4726668.1 conjugal transfer protein [Mycolicibacterium fortuitum]
MTSRKAWRDYRLRQVLRRAIPFVVYPCALWGALGACASACSNTAAPTDVNETLTLSTHGAEVVEEFLRTTPVGDVVAKPGPVEDRGDGVYDVTVTVTPSGEDRQQWLVPLHVIGEGDNRKYVATRTPSRVPVDSSTSAAQIKQPEEIKDGDNNPAWTTTDSFLTAWLTGNGDVDRLSNSDSVPKFSTPPYSQINLTKLVASGSVPATPTGSVDVIASVLTTDRSTYEQDYALTLKARDGQWIVDAIDATPPVEVPAS